MQAACDFLLAPFKSKGLSPLATRARQTFPLMAPSESIVGVCNENSI
jgi:hypothetical protein